jgi:hypothetical protein
MILGNIIGTQVDATSYIFRKPHLRKGAQGVNQVYFNDRISLLKA